MIHALLILEEKLPYQLIFNCPGCHKEHSIFVTTGKTYATEFTDVWSYKILNEDIRKGIKKIEIHPSFDASQVCGYHGPSRWEATCMTLESNQARDNSTEDWLKNT